jgi:hypothetical protein
MSDLSAHTVGRASPPADDRKDVPQGPKKVCENQDFTNLVRRPAEFQSSFLFHCIDGEDVWGAGLYRKNGMYDLRVRRGPEGRCLNVSPARKGWDMEGG